MTHIPHSTHQDEARFVMAISDLITKGELTANSTWNKSSKDEKAKLVRKKAADQEAEEAEELAKELGVWDEFYGSGKEGSRKGKGKGKGKSKGKKKAEGEGEGGAGEDEDEEDHSALQALILKKRQNAGSFLDNLAAKYADPQPRAKGKRKKDATASGEVDESPKTEKRRRDAEPEPGDIDDEEFAKLQEKLFKDKGAEAGKSTRKQGRAGRGRKS